MRKDFLVDPYQVLEARAAGAGGVLVIVRMLSRSAIDALLACAGSLGLFVLLEAFDARDIELVCELIEAHAGASPLLAGVNCRDLATLQVLPQRLLELAPLLPARAPRVAQSGAAADAAACRAPGAARARAGALRGGDPASGPGRGG